MRVRVEPEGTEGEAFWAGVYDVERKLDMGRIAPMIGETAPGYRWYEVATWLPEHGQYVWAGPGRFEAGTQSAVRAVYIDALELRRADPRPPR